MAPKRWFPAFLIGCLTAVALAGCTKSCAVPTLVKHGRIVLVKKGSAIGAFILHNQGMGSEERAEYDWYYRTDGKGAFKASDTGSFRKGTGGSTKTDMRPFVGIRFAPFA